MLVMVRCQSKNDILKGYLLSFTEDTANTHKKNQKIKYQEILFIQSQGYNS